MSNTNRIEKIEDETEEEMIAINIKYLLIYQIWMIIFQREIHLMRGRTK